MEPSGLKRYLPRSLTGRAGLILVLPVLILQAVVSIMFIQRHVEDVTSQMAANVLVELTFMREAIEAAPDLNGARRAARDLAPRLELEVYVPSRSAVQDARDWYDLSGRAVMEALRAGMEGIGGIDLARSKSRVSLEVETRHGPIEMRFPRRRVSASNPHQLLVLMVLTGALMTLIAYIFLRNQLRPITRLAHAAGEFGKGRHAPYKPSGAAEVRLAGLAFLDMRDRIERQIEQRTLMLSGVSHDLRTPLTRMTLGLSMLEQSDEVVALRGDVEDMQRLVDEFLAFSRGDALEEAEEVEPVALLRTVVEQAQAAGQQVQFVAGPASPGPVRLRPMAIRRALENLVGNGVRYGSSVWVSFEATRKTVCFRVEDDGPGIPEDMHSQAVKAFARLDPARNQNVPGVGLGLSIAADIARSHGGRLKLGRSAAHGGLQADLSIAR